MDKLKKSLLDIYQYNKKLVFIVLGLLIVLIVVLFCVNLGEDKNNSSIKTEYIEKLVLFGNKEITINQGDKYLEPGYYAVTNYGEIKTDYVTVTGVVDTDTPGTYFITYEIDNKKITRTITVLKKEVMEGNINFTLEGNSLIVLEQGNEYIEPGYKAIDSNDGDITDKVTIDGFVDVNTPGTYVLTYKIKNSTNQEKTLERTIIIGSSPLSATILSSNTSYTNQSIKAIINIVGSSYNYIKFPNGTVSREKNINYEITSNGTYNFYLYDKSGNYVVKTFDVNNIDKAAPTGSCKLSDTNGKSVVKVSASDNLSGINNYSYADSNNNLLIKTTNNTYNANTHLDIVNVTIYDKAGNTKKISCSNETKGNLEVHFINVGREDAILIRSSQKTIFIDGGCYKKKSIITPYLKALGVTHIDAMIGSHLHYNHIQAQADILANFTVDKIYYPQDLSTCLGKYCESNDQKYILSAIKKYNKSINLIKVRDNIDIGDINIYAIGPIDLKTLSSNKYCQNYNSSNFILTYGKTKFMFTGDYMQSSNILKNFSKELLDIDVLKYPHHGNASIDKTLINYMSPKYVVVTSASDELAKRSEKSYLKKQGASIYYSYKSKNILIISDGTNLQIKTNVNPSDYKK